MHFYWINLKGIGLPSNHFNIEKNSKIQLLGVVKNLEWNQEGESLTILIPENIIDAPAYTFKITQIT